MTITWIVAADASRARVLQVADREEKLVEVEDLVNPEGRMNDRELTSDAHPRFSGHGGLGKPGAATTSGPGSDRQEKSAVEHQVELFARRIGDHLEKARTDHRYDRLCLVAPPRFLGALRKELSNEVRKLVAEELPKDLSWLGARDLERYFAERPELKT
jgi:protein required for attachment to host cells